MTAVPQELIRPTTDLIGKNDFTLGSFVFHENGLEAMGTPTWEEWLECGKFLFNTKNKLHFLIGDWLNIGELYYKERYKQAAERFGYSVQTLRQDKWVAGQIPRERRNTELSFDHHQSVAKLDPEDQEILLGEAVEEDL